MNNQNYGNRNKRYTPRSKSQHNKKQMSNVDKLVDLANKKHNIVNEEKLSAEGVAVHSVVNRRTATAFLSNLNDYSDRVLDDREELVPICRKLRTSEGICSTVADLLLDFGVTGGFFYSDNEELQKILNSWTKVVNAEVDMKKTTTQKTSGLKNVLRKIFDDYLTDGDSIFTLSWKDIPLIPEDKTKYTLPANIRVLDTTTLSINEAMASLGYEMVSFKPPREIEQIIRNPRTPEEREFIKFLPKEWISSIRAGKEIILDPNATYHIKRNEKDYKAWGTSLFVKAFTAIYYKRLLQAVDEATIDGLINRMTIFTLGLEDREKNPKYHVPSPTRVNQLINLLTNQKRSNAIVWPGPDLKVQDFGPDGKILEFVDKFKQADKDILRALHVSPVLIDGGSDGQAIKDWVAFLSTEVGLDTFREAMANILTSMAKDVAVANKMSFERLYYKFDSHLLKDDQRIKTFALKMYELGGISTQTFVQIMGYDWETEKARKEKEQAEDIQELFRNKSLPYQGDPEDGQKVEPDGRPLNSEDDPETKVEKASVQFNENLFESFYDRMSDDLMKRNEMTDDFSVIELALISGFASFVMMVESYTRSTFRKVVSNAGAHQPDLDKILFWNRNYLDNFYLDLKSELQSTFFDINQFKDVLDSQRYRVSMYAREVAAKIGLVANVIDAKEKGYDSVIWRAHIDEKTCSECVALNGSKHSVDSIFSKFPRHPQCRCDLEFYKEDDNEEA